MGDSTIFGFGVFVVLIFLAGLVYTFREFRHMNEANQRNWKKKSMDIKKESE
jgi:hypothetical protein